MDLDTILLFDNIPCRVITPVTSESIPERREVVMK